MPTGKLFIFLLIARFIESSPPPSLPFIRLHSRESFTSTSSTSSNKGRLSGGGGATAGGGHHAKGSSSHEKFNTDTDTDQESLPASFKGSLEGSLNSSLRGCSDSSKAPPKPAKKVKRVQFQDGNFTC